MVKQVGDKCIFEAPWADTVEGAVHKYPNDHSKNVSSVDILERYIDDNGNLVSKKMMRTKFDPNVLMRKIMPILGMPPRTHQTSLELNKIDVGRKYFQLKSLNKTYLKTFRCFEVLEYTPDADDPKNSTQLDQYAIIDMYAKQRSFTIRWAINQGESLFASQYVNTSRNNRQGLRDVIQNLQLEWADLAKEVAQDLAKDAEKIGKEIINKVDEVGHEIVEKSVEIGQELVEKSVEVGQEIVEKTVDEGSKIVKTVENVLRASSKNGNDDDGDDKKK